MTKKINRWKKNIEIKSIRNDGHSDKRGIVLSKLPTWNFFHYVQETFTYCALVEKFQSCLFCHQSNKLNAMRNAYAKRFEAVFLCVHPKWPKLTYLAASKYIRKWKSFVEKWVKRYKECKNVDDFPNRGTKRRKADYGVVFEKSGLDLATKSKKLREKGLEVSHITIRKYLCANNVKFRSTLKKPLLSEKHVEKRLAWAHANIDRDWSNVICKCFYSSGMVLFCRSIRLWK